MAGDNPEGDGEIIISPSKLKKMLGGGGAVPQVNVFATAQINSGQMFVDALESDHRAVRMIVQIVEGVVGGADGRGQVRG